MKKVKICLNGEMAFLHHRISKTIHDAMFKQADNTPNDLHSPLCPNINNPQSVIIKFHWALKRVERRDRGE